MEPLVLDALRAHAPFDRLEPEALALLERALSIAYYARGEGLVAPAQGVADRVYIVRQGRVRADVVLGPGEMFPVGAVIGRRATTNTYRAETDVFAWEIAADDFRALLEKSAHLRAFCNDHLAMLLAESQRRLRAEMGEAVLDRAGMLAALSTVLRRAPVHCAPRTPLREALERMRRERVGSIVVAGEGMRPVGIFTTQDVLERVESLALHAPIESVMSAPVFALEAEATLAEAALAMAQRRIRHVVVTRDGRLAGVVSERDLFALQRVGLTGAAERIRAAATLERLVELAADTRSLARQLLAQGVGAESLTAMMSALNDSITQRVIELAAARHTLPEAWCWLALGSEGRMEQTFVSDQDNALLYSGAQAGALAFADEVNRGLDACGFPLCVGDIMARNPQWCLDLAAWRRLFDGWIRNNDPQALLNASIFFDFRPLHGDARLAGALRESVLRQAGASRTFQRALAETTLRVRPPLGLVSDFSEDELDLKAYGARPFVDAARVLALSAGSPETGTAARLRAAGERTAVEAFHFVQALRLRTGRNRVRVDELNGIDRRVLKEAFRQAVFVQERVRLDHQL